MTLLQRLLGIVLGTLFLVAVLVFASLALGVIVAVGLVVWGWLWWKTRELRREQSHAIIEGEFRDVTAAQRLEDRERRRL
jgi:hypothetical protein